MIEVNYKMIKDAIVHSSNDQYAIVGSTTCRAIGDTECIYRTMIHDKINDKFLNVVYSTNKNTDKVRTVIDVAEYKVD